MINYIFAVKAPAADAHIVESQQMSLLTKDPTTIALTLEASHNSFILGQDRFLHEWALYTMTMEHTARM